MESEANAVGVVGVVIVRVAVAVHIAEVVGVVAIQKILSCNFALIHHNLLFSA